MNIDLIGYLALIAICIIVGITSICEGVLLKSGVLLGLGVGHLWLAYIIWSSNRNHKTK